MEIILENVTKYYSKNKVLESFNTNFKLDEGLIYVLAGPNGAGKTTVLKILAGIIGFSEGKITLSHNIINERWYKENILYIPTGERFLRIKNTLLDNVLYLGALKGTDIKIINNNIKKFKELMKIEHLLFRRIETMSTGERKKSIILCALCCNIR